MTNGKTEKVWEKTSVQGLLRHKGGGYYARTISGGRQIWKSLKTKHFEVAKARLRDRQKEHTEQVEARDGLAAGKLTFGEAAQLHLSRIDGDPSTKPTTKHYWRQVITALLKSWPEARDKDVRKITPAECKEWAARFGSKASPTRFNNSIAAVRNVFAMAIEAGARSSNPAADLKRARIRAKALKLPTHEQFAIFTKHIETAGAWCSRDCADFVRFCAFTGCRKSEAAQVTWADIDERRGVLKVRGDFDTGTKNWEVREVPIVPDLATLIQSIRERRPGEQPSEKVLKVQEAQKAMDSAAKKAGMDRITHHDLRHLFATVCIEAGVDIPTVSRWLGHKDGGALAMKTYGHLRDEHSQAAAQKVRFS